MDVSQILVNKLYPPKVNLQEKVNTDQECYIPEHYIQPWDRQTDNIDQQLWIIPCFGT